MRHMDPTTCRQPKIALVLQFCANHRLLHSISPENALQAWMLVLPIRSYKQRYVPFIHEHTKLEVLTGGFQYSMS